jgi:glycosyltransferase involved in cell wall biosynthesis
MLTAKSRAGLEGREEVEGVQIRRIWMPGKSPLGWIAHTGASLPAHARLAADADVVHAHTFASGVPPLVTRSARRRPYVLTLHTSHFLLRAGNPVWRAVFRRIIRAADYLLATSEEIRRVALRIYPHPRSEVMTNAVDTDRFAPAGDHDTARGEGGRTRIVVPRRLFPKNGVEYFVRALPRLVKERDVHATVVGDGPERARLEVLAAELGVADRIEFLGARANQEMPQLLRKANLAVIPSLLEATSIAALEAMACGLPVAASRVGGLPEIVDEGVGALFEPRNPESLAHAVAGLLGRADLPELGREARRRVVENWSLDRLVERHLEIYRELLDEAEASATQTTGEPAGAR